MEVLGEGEAPPSHFPLEPQKRRLGQPVGLAGSQVGLQALGYLESPEQDWVDMQSVSALEHQGVCACGCLLHLLSPENASARFSTAPLCVSCFFPALFRGDACLCLCAKGGVFEPIQGMCMWLCVHMALPTR